MQSPLEQSLSSEHYFNLFICGRGRGCRGDGVVSLWEGVFL